MTFPALAEALTPVFRSGVSRAMTDEEFRDLALRIFRFQCEANLHYGAFVARRGVHPPDVSRWEEVPFLPTRAFKSAALFSGDPKGAEGVFRTSGTSEGPEGRGTHFVRSLDLYRESLLPNFMAHLLPEGEEAMRVLCLLPSPEAAPDSSLSHMMGEVARLLYPGKDTFFVGGDGSLDGGLFRRALVEAEEAGDPVLVAGTAFGFVRWIETARERGWRSVLPEGSRIMETGGYKGRTEAKPREELYGEMEEAFGIPWGRMVNEYGMTELLSQFYEPVLLGEMWGGRDEEHEVLPQGRGEGSGASDGVPDRTLEWRFHRGPPWVRTLVLDPLSLEPLPQGELGILAHFDLANLGSVAAVLTEDLGRQVPHGFQLHGRIPGSEPRGCSLSMEDFLSSLEGSS